ncbi:MAG: glycosyltransferase family 4 protein [Deltaproteobacteria bacterium]|nr:glycosyltransferase family 4 protein [Kofleriaceae bacterium]
MKVGIDASNLRQGGGRTHLVELLAHGDSHLGRIEEVIVWGSSDTLSKLPRRDWITPRHEPMLDGSLVQRLLWQETRLVWRARDVDLVFAPGGVTSPLVRPRVVMSRNLLPFDERERARYGWSPTRLRLEILRFGQSQNFVSADGLIFLNEFARARVTASLSKPPRKVAVIPHGVADRFRHPARVPRPLSEVSSSSPLRVLYVSSLAPYKHQCAVIEAIASLRDEIPLELTLVGGSDGSGYADKVKRSLSDAVAAGARISYRGQVGFDELDREYVAAELFVFASSCENMPNIMLEAMSSGLPIACARRGPMPEMLGDAGVYFDPERPEEIAASLRTLASDTDLRRRCAEIAVDRVKEFSWCRCARDTFSFLSDVANGKNR